MKNKLIHFLGWMNRKAADEPMSLETDHDDIAMMYLQDFPQSVPTDEKIEELSNEWMANLEKAYIKDKVEFTKESLFWERINYRCGMKDLRDKMFNEK